MPALVFPNHLAISSLIITESMRDHDGAGIYVGSAFWPFDPDGI